jgi:predicted lipid-binding transport protein (Tim44 family)
MSLDLRFLTLAIAALTAPAGVFAQTAQAPAATSSSQSTAQSEAGEPRAMTSEAAPAPASEPAPAPAKAPAPRPAPGSHTPAGAAPGAKPTAADRLELGTATVTGDREQPKVMYIVPWKKSDIGDLSGKPMNSLLDEALAPVDRDEFKRQVMYYQVVKADASQNGAAKPPAAQGEK